MFGTLQLCGQFVSPSQKFPPLQAIRLGLCMIRNQSFPSYAFLFYDGCQLQDIFCSFRRVWGVKLSDWWMFLFQFASVFWYRNKEDFQVVGVLQFVSVSLGQRESGFEKSLRFICIIETGSSSKRADARNLG